MKARPYQQAATDALFHYFSSHPLPTDNPVVAAPTGTGKAFMIANFMAIVLRQWPGQRILNLVHVKELVEQNADTMRRIWPQAPIGIFSAGLKQRVAHMPITFAGTKSVAANLASFGRQDIVIVDECHLIPEKEESEYQKVLAYFRALNPNLRVVGFSATPFRTGLGMITDGNIFTHVAYDLTGMEPFNWLIDEGYLSPLIPIQTEMVIDVSKVARSGGDFVAKHLQDTVNREYLTRAALRETMVAAANRNHWLIFASGIEHAEAVRDMLVKEFGVPTNVVHGKLSAKDRDAALLAFKNGEVRACVNNQILTTGFDMPKLDCIICLRPTDSVVLHVQILGRGTRPLYAPGYDLDTAEGRHAAMKAGGKNNCLVLDFAGNVSRLGPINDPRIPKRKGEGAGDVPVKLCTECGCLNHISNRVCDNCGSTFPIIEKITEKASTAQIIAKHEPPKVEPFNVDRITYEKNAKPGRIPTLKVMYWSGLQRFTEHVCLEHFGNPIMRKAHAWWKERTDRAIPSSVDEAISQIDSLRRPKQIRVWINAKPPEVRSAIFD